MSAQVSMFGGAGRAAAPDLVTVDTVGAGVVVRGPVPPGLVWRVRGRNAAGAWIASPCDGSGSDDKTTRLCEVDGRHPALTMIATLPHAARRKHKSGSGAT